MLDQRGHYRQEIERLRLGMTEFELERADALLAAEEKRLAMMVELVRRQARGDQELHLAVSLDSGVMYLRRAGAVLREIQVEIGPSRAVGDPPGALHLSAPLGKHAVQRVVEAREPWEVPSWVYAERGLPVPDDRRLAGALGAVAVVLEGGTVIYARPTQGPLADPDWVMPGAIRAEPVDLRAIVANLRTGASVYFY